MSGLHDGELIRRVFPAELTPSGDGRTLEIRIVPYNEVARVAEPPTFEPYEEMFVPGAFDKQLNAANRVSVFMNVEHEEGIRGVVGRGSQLREEADGLHGTFRMLAHSDADKALELVNEGDLVGVSAEFIPTKSVREGGLVKRLKARLVNIALVRPSGTATGVQAYKGAEVLAVRTSSEDEPEPDPAPDPDAPPEEPAPDPDPSPEEESVPAAAMRTTAVDEVLERAGFEPLLKRAVVRIPWDGSASRFTDEQYQRSCLIDRGGDAPVKERCSLPVLEPNGDLNTNALGAAAARLNQVQASAELKAQAARKLRRYYSMANMEPPASLMAMAGR